MTSSEFFRSIRERFPCLHRDQWLYEEKRGEVPREIRRVVLLFRWLLALGGKIPVPVVVIHAGEPAHASVYTRDLCREGKGIELQLLYIHPQQVATLLADWRARCAYTPMESALRLAAHEARHCLQHCRHIGSWRSAQWLHAYLASVRGAEPAEGFLYFGEVIHEPEALRAHMDAELWETASRKQRQKKLARELDAAVTGVACAACWRYTHDIVATTRLLHG